MTNDTAGPDDAQGVEIPKRLRELRITLKSGDYDGADLMRAWCAMADAANYIDAELARIKAAVDAAIVAERERLLLAVQGFLAKSDDSGDPWDSGWIFALETVETAIGAIPLDDIN